jgi:nucleoside phosphorylase
MIGMGTVDVGIITIRTDEFEAVFNRLPPTTPVVRRRHYNVTNVGDCRVALVRCLEQGNQEALTVAIDLIEEMQPAWMLVVGIAGGIPSPELTLGDVVVSTRIHDFSVSASIQSGSDEFAMAGGPLHPRAAAVVANLPALQQAMAGWNDAGSIKAARPPIAIPSGSLYGDDKWQYDVRTGLERHLARATPNFAIGPITSSDRLIKDTEILQGWRKVIRQDLAVEMEAAGAYRAAHARGVPFIAIRGISDIVGFRRDPAWTGYACHTAAAFAVALLRTGALGGAAGATETKTEVHEPTLRTALLGLAEILLDDGYRRLRPDAPTIEKPDDVLRWSVVPERWPARRNLTEHLLRLAKIHLKNHRHASEQYAKWGSALAPPIVINTMEEAGTGLVQSVDELLSIMAELRR